MRVAGSDADADREFRFAVNEHVHLVAVEAIEMHSPRSKGQALVVLGLLTRPREEMGCVDHQIPALDYAKVLEFLHELREQPLEGYLLEGTEPLAEGRVVQTRRALHSAERGDSSIKSEDALHVSIRRGFEQAYEIGCEIDQRSRVEVLFVQGLQDLFERNDHPFRFLVVRRYFDAAVSQTLFELHIESTDPAIDPGAVDGGSLRLVSIDHGAECATALSTCEILSLGVRQAPWHPDEMLEDLRDASLNVEHFAGSLPEAFPVAVLRYVSPGNDVLTVVIEGCYHTFAETSPELFDRHSDGFCGTDGVKDFSVFEAMEKLFYNYIVLCHDGPYYTLVVGR